MKEKLKYKFLYIIPLHCSKFYKYFLFCCAQGRHFFCNIECSTGTFLSEGGILKETAFFQKSLFTELSFSIATVFSAKI